MLLYIPKEQINFYDFIYLFFRERGREGGREGEKHRREKH